MLHSIASKRKKAYSLLELIVSLAIIAMATVVMVNFLVLSLKISIVTLGRSFVREEVSNSLLLISRDIRNATSVTSINCPDTFEGTCEIVFSRENLYRWRTCPDGTKYRLCRDKWDAATSGFIEDYRSSSSVNIDYFNLSYGYSDSFINQRINIILTLAASHARNDLSVNDVVRQTSLSTRNYEF